MPEITDQEFAILAGSKKVLDKLIANPKTKYAAENLIKQNFPDTQTTVDRAKPFIDRMNAIENKIDNFVNSTTNAQIDAQMNAAFGQLRAQHYTEEGLEKIKQVMIKEKISNPLAAAAWWEKQNPPAPQEPSVFSPNSWNFGSADGADDDLKLLWANEDRWADKEAGRALADYRRGKIDD